MKQKKIYSSGLLKLTALIWGVAFVAQSVGMDYVGPFTFNAVRSLLGAIVLLPVIVFLDRHKSIEKKKEERKPENKKLLLMGGISCGVALTIASSLQQIGILYTTAGKAGFITSLYMMLVPIFGIFLKKKVEPKVWFSVVLAMIGMYMLSITEGFAINKGDLLIFLCAIIFALHILIIDYFSPFIDGVKMSCVQFFVCSMVCSVPMFLFEDPQMDEIISAGVPILYAGIMSCGVAYTLQIVAQRNVNPVVASLILSLESVFAVLAGWIIIGEILSKKEMIGCVFVFLAILLSQLPDISRKQKLIMEEE